MTQKVKKIKQMQPNSQWSADIPIGVTLDNGLDLEERFDKTEYVFDNVAEMVAADYLKAGDKVKTLGYSIIGDNGDAYYIIKESLTADSYTVLELDNDLYAEMIIKDKIKINSFGADYAGQTDSATIFNFAFNYLNDRWLNNDFSINTVECSGTYLINSTITIPVWCRLRGTGYTIFFTNVSGSAFKIGYISQNLPSNFPGHKQDYEVAEIINFEKGGMIRVVPDGVGAIGIEIGTSSNWGSTYNVARTRLTNIRIRGYSEAAIKMNPYNNYIINFDKINFETNTVGMQFGDADHVSVTNAGENITFNDCIFSGENYAFKWYCDGFDVSIINSSIDFINNALFYDVNNKGYRYVKFSNGHIEVQPSYIVDNFGDYSSVRITECKIYLLNYIDSFLHNCSSDFRFSCENNKFNFPTATTSDPTKLIYYDNFISKGNFYGNGRKSFNFAGNNMLPSFDSIADGDYSVNYNTGYKIQGYKFSFNSTYINETVKVVTDDYGYTGHKSIQFSVNTPTTNSVNINVETPKIYNKGYDYINMNSLLYNCKIPTDSINIKVSQYDSNDNLLTEHSYYHSNSPVNTDANVWHIPNYIVSAPIRPDCHYFILTYNHGNVNNNQSESTTGDPIVYKIGGLYCFE